MAAASLKPVTLTPGAVTLADLRAIHAGAPFSIAAAWAGVEAAAASVRRIVQSGRTVYGREYRLRPAGPDPHRR